MNTFGNMSGSPHPYPFPFWYTNHNHFVNDSVREGELRTGKNIRDDPDFATIPGEHPENIREKGVANNSEFLFSLHLRNPFVNQLPNDIRVFMHALLYSLIRINHNIRQPLAT